MTKRIYLLLWIFISYAMNRVVTFCCMGYMRSLVAGGLLCVSCQGRLTDVSLSIPCNSDYILVNPLDGRAFVVRYLYVYPIWLKRSCLSHDLVCSLVGRSSLPQPSPQAAYICLLMRSLIRSPQFRLFWGSSFN